MKILVLNSGSSSQKSALFELEADSPCDHPAAPVWEGKLDWDGGKETLGIRNSRGKKLQAAREAAPEERSGSVRAMLGHLWSGETAVVSSREEIDLIGHRIVHGGARLTEPVLVNSEVTEAIARVAEIAPLHNKSGLEGIRIAEALLPGKPQIAVFDTGFHRTLPPAAVVYPGPYEWLARGIRRYGFHGINHEYCAKRTAHILKRDSSELRIVSCHLGNGCSLAAIAGGRSVDTTMGFTPLEGLMMGTRSGSIDPGILFHLLRGETASAESLDDSLNHHSGLLGVSGVSSDMRDVLKAAGEGNARAKLAFDIFVHRLETGIAAMTASLGGVDAVVFTAGIGENSAEVRRAACAKLGFVGIELDQEKNRSAEPDVDISGADSMVRVLVIRAQEDWTIAQECVRLSSHIDAPTRLF
ncbi:MAG: acetate kinase [Acidobacteria bacterium]|nr:acetate kinase [Acidobacteriota bacterium]